MAFVSVSLVSVTEENNVPFFISTMRKKYGFSLCLLIYYSTAQVLFIVNAVV